MEKTSKAHELEDAIYDMIEHSEEEGITNEEVILVLEQILADRKSIKEPK